MGLKQRARAIMEKAGVPILPGSARRAEKRRRGDSLAADIGYPIMLKAAAGGGGRGMRIVRSEVELPGLLVQAQSEAAAAFSCGDVYMEKLVEAPRHIEFQILADEAGNVEVLGNANAPSKGGIRSCWKNPRRLQFRQQLRARISDRLRTRHEGHRLHERWDGRVPDGRETETSTSSR